MTPRKRPACVPANAHWSDKFKRWECGVEKNGKHVGTWKFWDANGKLQAEVGWDDQGRAHGRRASFHPDGALAYEFLSDHGKMLQVTHYAAASGKARFAPKLPFAVARNVMKAEYVRAKKAWEWRLYDLAGNRIDDEGKPLGVSRGIDKQVRALVGEFRAPRSETFEQAIARANEWFTALIALRAKAIQGAWGRKPGAVWSVGKPATRAQLAALERWIGGSLPPSYRRFLSTLGGIAFIDRVDTIPIADVRATSERYTNMAFASAFSSKRRLAGRAWTTAKHDVVVGFREQELADPPFLKIATVSEGAYLLVPHARDPRREAPVVHHYSDEASTDVGLAGRSFDNWVSARVDQLIADLTNQLA